MSTAQHKTKTRPAFEGGAIPDTRADGLRVVADHLPGLAGLLEDLGGYSTHLREARDCFLNGNVLGGLQDFEDALEVLVGIQGTIGARISEIQTLRNKARERGIL